MKRACSCLLRKLAAAEDKHEALARELGATADPPPGREGLSQAPPAPAVLFAIYFNGRISRRDHVALYVARSFRQSAPPRPNREIVGHGFFAVNSLPASVTPATRLRIEEVFAGRAAAEFW